jgi:hypothetical protein
MNGSEVVLTVPADYAWGNSEMGGDKTIGLGITQEQASQYVTLEEMRSAGWVNVASIMMAFCGVTPGWRDFSRLVKRVGVHQFDRVLMEGIATCPRPDWTEDRGAKHTPQYTDFYVYISQSLELLKETTEYNVKSSKLDLAYMIGMTCGADSDPQAVLRAYRKVGLLRFIAEYKRNVGVDMFLRMIDNDIDIELVTKLHEGIAS